MISCRSVTERGMGVVSRKRKVANAAPVEGRVLIEFRGASFGLCVSVSVFERIGKIYMDTEVLFDSTRENEPKPSFE